MKTDPTESINSTDNKFSKFDILLFNKGWNDNNEKLVVSIGENAASYKWMHEKAFVLYSNLNKMISVIIIFANAILTAQSTFQNPYDACTNDSFQRVLIYIVTAMSIIFNFLGFQEISTNHRHAIKNFSELYHDIQQQMCLYRKDRHSAVGYIQTVMKKYDILITESPSIPNTILYYFKRSYRHSDISKPDTIHKIDIITDPQGPRDPQGNYQAMQRPQGSQAAQAMQATPPLKNPYLIENDITEEDSEDLEKYLKTQANDAKIKYEFARFTTF